MTSAAVRIRAFAKINLRLRVGARQADGYHPLETVFQSLALHDVVTCSASRGAFRVVCDDPAVPTDERNLAWKAARALWRHLGRPGDLRGCTVALAKQIPMAAGLGGGSADAAATLAGLNRLWRAGLPGSGLAALAAGLGADVPYFLTGGTALGLGRGDEVYPLADIGPRWVVLVCPPFGVSTADAYGWFDADRAGETAGRVPKPAAMMDAWASRCLPVENDLEAPVVRRYPAIGTLVGSLGDQGAEAAAMTGSGSAVFGLFATEARATRAARAAAGAGAWSTVTRTADRRACRRMLGLLASGR
jgi:4-diphosphocytidyl-2-C-methyl-D-erythritol kinase